MSAYGHGWEEELEAEQNELEEAHNGNNHFSVNIDREGTVRNDSITIRNQERRTEQPTSDSNFCTDVKVHTCMCGICDELTTRV